MRVSINIAARQVQDPRRGFDLWLPAGVSFPPERLQKLQLSESTQITEDAAAVDRRAVKGVGVSIAIDDFGVGPTLRCRGCATCPS